MKKSQVIEALLNASAECEDSHRQYQKAERYGNAAYYQGKRDAFNAAADIVSQLSDDSDARAQLDKLRAALATLADTPAGPAVLAACVPSNPDAN